MLQTLTTPTKTVPITIIRNGQPLEIEIDYALYLQLQEAIDEWQSGQRAAAAYAEWQQDPSTGQPWEEFKAELVAEGLLDADWNEQELQLIAQAEQISAALDRDPSTLVSHAELKRRLAEKKAYVAN